MMRSSLIWVSTLNAYAILSETLAYELLGHLAGKEMHRCSSKYDTFPKALIHYIFNLSTTATAI